MRRHQQSRAQSTVELAMLLPVLLGLLALAINLFRLNFASGAREVVDHTVALERFDHGDGTLLIDGVEVSPGSYVEDMPFDLTDFFPGAGGAGGPLGVALNVLGPIVTDNLIDKLFSSIPFLRDSNIVSGYARGATGSMANQYVTSGFKPGAVDRDVAHRAGLVGAASSDQVRDLSRDAGYSVFGDSRRSASEILGGSIRGAVIGGADSKYQSGSDAFFGSVRGALSSDPAQAWFDRGNDVLKGAARGAVESSITSLQAGKWDAKEALKGSAMGAFQTRTVARQFPGASGLNDPRSAASFNSANAVLGTVISKGSSATVGDVFYSATTAAFFSGQSQGAIRGDSEGVWAGVKTTAAATAFNSAMAAAQGADLAAVGQSAAATAAGAAVNSAVGAGMGLASRGVSAVGTTIWNAVKGATTPDEVGKAVSKEETVEETADKLAKANDKLTPTQGSVESKK